MKVHRMLCIRGSTDSPVLARMVWFAGHADKHGSVCMRAGNHRLALEVQAALQIADAIFSTRWEGGSL